MGRHRHLLSRILVCACACLVSATPALAAEALQRPAAGETLLAYGQTYDPGGGVRTHRGLDIAAGAGEGIAAAADGSVTFAGLVPADGGGRVYAVTIRTSDSLRVTVSPLESVAVGAGSQVAAGDQLGVLAAAGDASSAAAHVHLSVREGDAYVDPAPLLAGSPAPSGDSPDGQATAPVTAGDEQPAAAEGAPAGAQEVRAEAGVAGGDAAARGVTAARGVRVASDVTAPSEGQAASARQARPRWERYQPRVRAAYCAAITCIRQRQAPRAFACSVQVANPAPAGPGRLPVPPGAALACAAALACGAVGCRQWQRQQLREVA